MFLVVGTYFFGQVGINTTVPGSTLAINGSIATKYRLLTGNYTATINDEYLDYKGTSDITVTLPASISGTGNFEGRIYEIRNGSTNNTITVQTSGTENIDIQTTNTNSIEVPAGYVATLKSNGKTTGATWILTLLGSGSIPAGASATITKRNYFIPQGSIVGDSFDVTDTSLVLVPNTLVTINTPSDKVVWLNFLLGVDEAGTGTGVPYLRAEVYLQPTSAGTPATTTTNQTLYATGIALIQQESVRGAQFQVSLSGVLNVPKGSYYVYVRMLRWANLGITSGTNQPMTTLSSSFSSAFLN
ncbi:hypothetical protein [Chryseobacterium sp. Mn2064]|uniref:hypothetical protein n=1 Tax=Chryseobacterium sp. Mn2064 TaxID=3395263 RepID=UPI003BDC60C1